MDFDMDLHRTEFNAFAPISIAEGGILPYEGRQNLQDANGLPSAVFESEQDGWISRENPILVRGAAKILPLAWLGDQNKGFAAGATKQEIARFASHMQGAGQYWAGPWSVLDLAETQDNSIGSYTAALRAAGATHVDRWIYSEERKLGLTLVCAGEESDGTMSLALHVVPVSWVWDRYVANAVSAIDLRWSWADVVALHEERVKADCLN